MLLPTGWKIATVDELKANVPRSCAAGPFGSSISAQYFVESGVPVIRGGNLSDSGLKFIPEDFVFITEDRARTFKGAQVVAGDLVFTCWGTLGQVGLIPSDGPFNYYVISNKQLKLRPNTEICSAAFLFYYFSTEHLRRHFQDIAIGSAVPGINLGLLKRIKVPLPPLAEQKKIAAILTAYDDLIENNKRRIALLEKMAEEIYREWFVRLRFPGHASTPVHKGVPEGWRRQSLGTICSMVKRGISPGYDDQAVTIVLNQRCIRGGAIDLGFARTHSSDVPKEKVVQFGDALINSTGVGTLGRVSVVGVEGSGWTVDSHITICRANPLKAHPFYVAHTVKLLQTQFEFLASGATGQTELNASLVKAIAVLVPPSALSDQFGAIASDMSRQQCVLSQSTQNLQKTRDLLLGRLISGKLRVDQVDIQFPPNMRESARMSYFN